MPADLPSDPALPVALVAGFDPFGGDARNPSGDAARALHGRVLAGHRVVGAVLPTAFGRSLPALDALLREHRPALVLACGLAGGRREIALERVAINLQDARIADNDGEQPTERPVLAGGPAAFFSTLPCKAMRRALRAAGFPAELSHSAGTFVCNHVFYALMHRLAQDGPGARGGFVHLPWPGVPGLPDAPALASALALAVEVAAGTPADTADVAGELH